ncbi:LAME_0B03664g1_1 [Lachancea meyersii CBS 8951]|uniref:LAME_0B03664g1_1 n=1 Tax=Lachancea meyersii CBS 8951 TaxID=1266667 RepID=A0A1G4IU72_9SACH|nr:LAME_0B03664g1_1 [Lachancea meyersii CBS 8951]
MGLKNLGSFFSLKALDSRLDPGTDQKRIQKANLGATKSRWNTLEFKLYYVAFAVIVPMMVKAAMSATNEQNPNFPRIEPLLSQGWIGGRKVDNSDSQYRFFRDNLPLLLGLAVLHVLLKKIVLRASQCRKVTFDLIFGLIFLFAAHGGNALRVLGHLLINFTIAKCLRRRPRVAKFLTWTYGIGSLFINDNYRKYPFGNVLSILSPLDSSFTGIIERWDVFYNFTLLRMLSFDMDFLEKWQEIKKVKKSATPSPSPPIKPELKRSASSATTLETICENGNNNLLLEERARLNAPHHIQDYSLSHYLAYITYTPLFIAGPIITFNDYLYQSQQTLPSINRKAIVIYALRFSFCVLTMEVVLHYIYAVAVSKTKAWEGDTPFEISMIGLFNLNIVWLKLLIPWRLFRLWSLVDGIDPPENMLRCMNNNFSALAFWRAWHRSFNKWVVRYIYIPLGGSNSRILTSLAVFSFVAIWHDIELKLLLWGWLIVLFLLPEITAQQYFSGCHKRPWYRYLRSVGAVFNIWMMMIANLFGFCLGYDGTVYLIKGLFLTWSGIKFLICANAALFVATQVMFEQREHEKRKGVNVKC